MNAYKFGVAYDITVRGCGENQKVANESQKVADDNGIANSDLVAVVISRIPPRWATPLRNARSSIYQYMNKNSMRVNGQCLVPLSKQAEFELGLNQLIHAYDASANSLYDACVSGEMARELENLGDLAVDVKALDCNDIRARYGVTVRINVDFDSPSVKTMLATMDAEVVKQLQERVQADAKASYDEALTEMSSFVTSKIHNLLTKLVEKVGVKGTKVKYILNDIKEVVEQLPSYNILNNEKVTETIAEIYKVFGTLEKDDFQDDKTVESIKANASTLLSRFKA